MKVPGSPNCFSQWSLRGAFLQVPPKHQGNAPSLSSPCTNCSATSTPRRRRNLAQRPGARRKNAVGVGRFFRMFRASWWLLIPDIFCPVGAACTRLAGASQGSVIVTFTVRRSRAASSPTCQETALAHAHNCTYVQLRTAYNLEISTCVYMYVCISVCIYYTKPRTGTCFAARELN